MGEKLADSFAYPPRALRADRAAAYLSMSTTTFLKLVEEGRLPKPKRLGGIVFWDRLALDSFVEHYEGEPEQPVNSIDKLLGITHEPTKSTFETPPKRRKRRNAAGRATGDGG